jgi:Ca2+-binding RTX toxin-like protein
MAVDFVGTEGSDRIRATSDFYEEVRIFGYGGNDELVGAVFGNNLIYGSLGADTVRGGSYQNVLYGGAGNDLVDGSIWEADDTLYGGSGRDTLLGSDDGTNFLDGGAGADRMEGGNGQDTFVVDRADDRVIETYVPYYDNDPDPIDEVQSFVSWTLGANLESLVLLGKGRVNGTGNADENHLTGNNAANQLLGLSGRDFIYGGGGNDVISGGYGYDLLVGDAGNDRISGDAGNDRLIGFTGRDHLDGGEGDDMVGGGVGNDVLTGGVGNDTLIGGRGFDDLTGGSGRDAFRFLAATESPATDRDIIRDFAHRQDLVDLSLMDADTTSDGVQNFRYIRGQDFHGIAGELRTEGNQIEADVDGDGFADFAVTLGGVTDVFKYDLIV